MNTPEVSYDVARHQIKSGDAVNVYRPKGLNFKCPLYSVIGFMTGSPIYHVAIAVWMTSPNGIPRLMCVESNLFGGKRIVPLSIYSSRIIEVMPLPLIYSFEAMEEDLFARVAQQSYGLLNFLSIGLREFFGIKRRPKKIGVGQVCSELVSSAWIRAGFPFEEEVVSPGRLKAEMMKLGVQPLLRISPVDSKRV